MVGVQASVGVFAVSGWNCRPSTVHRLQSPGHFFSESLFYGVTFTALYWDPPRHANRRILLQRSFDVYSCTLGW